MSQSRLSSFAETCISIAIGFLVSVAITAWLLPAYGHPVTLSDNVQITAIYTVASIARGYLVRRWFNRLSRRMNKRADLRNSERKLRDDWKYKAGTAEQGLREACCLLRECLPHITGGPPDYLNNRISVWLETMYPPNPKADVAPASGAHVQRVVGCEPSQGDKP